MLPGKFSWDSVSATELHVCSESFSFWALKTFYAYKNPSWASLCSAWESVGVGFVQVSTSNMCERYPYTEPMRQCCRWQCWGTTGIGAWWALPALENWDCGAYCFSHRGNMEAPVDLWADQQGFDSLCEVWSMETSLFNTRESPRISMYFTFTENSAAKPGAMGTWRLCIWCLQLGMNFACISLMLPSMSIEIQLHFHKMLWESFKLQNTSRPKTGQ